MPEAAGALAWVAWSVESLGLCNVLLLHHCHSQTHIDGRHTTTRHVCFMAHGRAGSRTTVGCLVCAVAARSVHAWSGGFSTTHPMPRYISSLHAGQSAATAHCNYAPMCMDPMHRGAYGLADTDCEMQMHAQDWLASDRSSTDTDDTLRPSPRCTTFVRYTTSSKPASPPFVMRTPSGSTGDLMSPCRSVTRLP
jgi:hypothetical protein